MQNVSNEYKISMKKPLRNAAYTKVDIGIINPDAQNSAYVNDTTVTYFSDIKGPLKNEIVQYVYCTMEQDLSRVDGSMVFLPREGEYIPHRSGIITNVLLGLIKIELGIKSLDIRGLTIDFSDNYPEDFSIVTNNTTVNITGNNKRLFETSEIFLDTDYFIIAPTKMIKGQNRLRIFSFLCGLGVAFDNSIIKNAKIVDLVSPITKTIPSIDFNFTIDNSNLAYNADDESNAVNYLKTEQLCNVYSGYELDNGTVEWIKSGTLKLKSWNANDTQASFTAVDKFEYMNETYKKGVYNKNGISLYKLAEDVLLDAGMEEKEYILDEVLKNTIVFNPIPVVKHKEALQIIANAGRCLLIQDRDGVIILKSAISNAQTSDYRMEYDTDLTKAPTCTQLEIVKELQVATTAYVQETSFTEIAKETVTLSKTNSIYTLEISEAASEYKFECVNLPSGANGKIIASSCYFVQIEFSGIVTDTVVEIVTSGKKYKKNSNVYKKVLDTIGRIETWNNPLISYAEHARDISDWLAKYFMSDKEYGISYRGDPRIDGSDLVTLERKNREPVEIVLYENTLNFNGAWSGNAKARRVVNGS